jgi:hypothetical protein
MVLDPFPVDADVAFDEVKPIVAVTLVELVVPNVHAVDFPVGLVEYFRRQGVADEAIDAENQ